MTQTAAAPVPGSTPLLDNSYARELDGAYVAWAPTAPPQPRAVRLNHALAAELGLTPHRRIGKGKDEGKTNDGWDADLLA